jgi:hypothetical protein
VKSLPVVPILLAGVLASCASPQLTPPAAGSLGRAMPVGLPSRSTHGTDALLYVADTTSNDDVVIYDQKGTNQEPLGDITDHLFLAYGLWVDTYGNLWVANVNYELESTIVRFPKGSSESDLIIADPNYNVTWVWVATDGKVYVVDDDYYGNSRLVKYDPPLYATPTFIKDPHVTFIWSVVGDAHGDLFVSGYSPKTGFGEIDERAAHSTHWRNTHIPLGAPGGLAFDRSGNLVASDTLHGVIETFPSGQTSPSNSIACSEECFSFAFNHRGDRLWIDEQYESNGTIDEVAYPSGTQIDSLPQPQGSLPSSVAASPDLYP